MTISSTIQLAEIGGSDTKIGEKLNCQLNSHWNNPRWVVLRIGDVIVTVQGSELILAAETAMRRP